MKVTVTEGKNIINYINHSLIIEKVVNAFNWNDNEGSIGEYYSVSDYSAREKNRLTAELNNDLIDGDESTILNSLAKFLDLFSNGEYLLSFYIEKLNAQVQILKEDINHGKENIFNKPIFYGWYYPDFDYENFYIYTLQQNKINEDRVQYYVDMINNGRSPKVLSIGNSSSRYILDGHHKLEAYLRLDKEIPFINIEKLSKHENEVEKSLIYAKKYLGKDEFDHMFFKNGLLYYVDYIKFPEFTILIDQYISGEILKAEKFNYLFGKLLIKMYNSEKEDEKHWFQKRFEKIKQTSYSSLQLPYFIKENGIGHWKAFPIILKSEIDQWLNKIKEN